jgi:hypothetical protein
VHRSDQRQRAQRQSAERLAAKWFELDTGHYPMLSMPDELTGLLTK